MVKLSIEKEQAKVLHLVYGVHCELVDAGEGPLVEWKVQVLILIELIFLDSFI